MALPTYGSSKTLPGTGNYNPLYDPGSSEYRANLSGTYQSPSASYVGGNPNNTVNPNSGAGLMVTGGPMHTAPVTVSSTTVPYGQWLAEHGGNPAPSTTPPPAQNPEVPAWTPPVQAPQQNQGTLFQNPGSEASIPSWKPPTQTANPLTDFAHPGLGTSQNRSQAANRYQSPSTRYARNQRTF